MWLFLKPLLVFGSRSSISRQFLAENPSSAKRKSLTSPEGKPGKRLKNSDTPGEDLGSEMGEKKRKKKDSLGLPLSPTIWGHMQVSCLLGTKSCKNIA